MSDETPSRPPAHPPEPFHHGLILPRVFPPGGEPAILARCPCASAWEEVPVVEEVVPVLEMRLHPDMLGWSGTCRLCGRLHCADRAEAGTL